MTVFLCIERYPLDSPLHKSDQITVPVAVWEELHEGHTGGERPLFVQLNPAENGPYARVCPAAGTALTTESCQIPLWMWVILGAPAPSTCWVEIQPASLQNAGSITLRPRRAATLAAMDEPLIQLAEELTGGGGATHSWACLYVGAELPLPCGDFDVLAIMNASGYPIPGACILNMDIDLELVPALNEQETSTPTPPPSPPHILMPEAMSFPGMESGDSGAKRFPGVGHRLG